MTESRGRAVHLEIAGFVFDLRARGWRIRSGYWLGRKADKEIVPSDSVTNPSNPPDRRTSACPRRLPFRPWSRRAFLLPHQTLRPHYSYHPYRQSSHRHLHPLPAQPHSPHFPSLGPTRDLSTSSPNPPPEYGALRLVVERAAFGSLHVGSRSTRPVVRDRSRRESDEVEVEVEVEVDIEIEPRYIIHQLRTNGR